LLSSRAALRLKVIPPMLCSMGAQSFGYVTSFDGRQQTKSLLNPGTAIFSTPNTLEPSPRYTVNFLCFLRDHRFFSLHPVSCPFQRLFSYENYPVRLHLVDIRHGQPDPSCPTAVPSCIISGCLILFPHPRFQFPVSRLFFHQAACYFRLPRFLPSWA